MWTKRSSTGYYIYWRLDGGKGGLIPNTLAVFLTFFLEVSDVTDASQAPTHQSTLVWKALGHVLVVFSTSGFNSHSYLPQSGPVWFTWGRFFLSLSLFGIPGSKYANSVTKRHLHLLRVCIWQESNGSTKKIETTLILPLASQAEMEWKIKAKLKSLISQYI